MSGEWISPEELAELDSTDVEHEGTGQYRFDPDAPSQVAMRIADGRWLLIGQGFTNYISEERIAEWTELVPVHRQPLIRGLEPVNGIAHHIHIVTEPSKTWTVDLTDLEIDSTGAPGVEVIELDGLPHQGQIVVEGGTISPVITRDKNEIRVDWQAEHIGRLAISWVPRDPIASVHVEYPA